MHGAHIGDQPGALNLVTKGHCTPEDHRSFYTKPLLLRPGDVADFCNMQKQTQRVRQNEETEEYIPNEGNGQITAKE